MSSTTMRIAAPEATLVAKEDAIWEKLLPIQDARILELGCGAAQKTRQIAQRASSILALEVDKTQLEKNLLITDLPNVQFQYGAAERIPAEDAGFDIVMMFKSLHHVPLDKMDQAFAEIRRVLKPGGLLYVSEPVYMGDLNEIIRMYNEEKLVREAAFEAEKRAVASGTLTLIEQVFFLQAMHYDNFEHFRDQHISVTHSVFNVTETRMNEIREKFNTYMTAEGANFLMPIRVDLFQK